MIYYFLPNAEKFGGVKVGCQFVEALNRLGLPAVLVTPDGRAPNWFSGRYAAVAEVDVIPRIAEVDRIVINWPADHRRLADLPGRKFSHAQGTDPTMDPLFADPCLTLLTCWPQAAKYVREVHGRTTFDVGISVAAAFFNGGRIKHSNQVAYMPRRGNGLATMAIRRCPNLDFVAIDEMTEWQVVAHMRNASYYLATANNEQFGLPALEAMAAGCVVLSVPVRGGMDYLRDGENCLLCSPLELGERLDWISRPEQAPLRAHLAIRARATACAYHPLRHLTQLAACLDAGLRVVLE